MPLSNMNIEGSILQVMKEEEEDEEEVITDANNVTAYTFSLAFIPQRENLKEIFASEKLENSIKLVNAVTSFENTTINDNGCDLNKVTVSGTQVEFVSNTDIITHTNNGITQTDDWDHLERKLLWNYYTIDWNIDIPYHLWLKILQIFGRI